MIELICQGRMTIYVMDPCCIPTFPTTTFTVFIVFDIFYLVLPFRGSVRLVAFAFVFRIAYTSLKDSLNPKNFTSEFE